MNKTFDSWESEELELTFGVNRVKNHPSLLNWLSAKCDFDECIKRDLIFIRTTLLDNADFWNEDELKFFFISQVVGKVNFHNHNFNAFTQRPLAAMVKDLNGNDVELKGRVEFVVARGKQHPRQPYFFLHEYKPEKRRETDPLGQLLAAMLAARALNHVEHLLYGCYIIGRNWFFVILEKDYYSVSDAFVATQDDLFDIYCILVACKNHIIEMTRD